MIARVYAFGIPGGTTVKVGFSASLRFRCAALRWAAGMPNGRILYTLDCGSIENARAVEARSHANLRAFALEGEWFSIDLETAIEAIEEAACDTSADIETFRHPAVLKRRSDSAKANWARRREMYGPTGRVAGAKEQTPTN